MKSNQKIKECGVDWVGHIPENWELKKFTTFQRSEKLLDSNLPYVGLENIEPQTGKLNSVNDEMRESDAKRFLKGDFIIWKTPPLFSKGLAL